MNQLVLTEDLLRNIIRETVKESIREERLSLYLSLLPKVSDKEMKEIEKICGIPSDYNHSEFVDITNLFE